MTKHTPSSDTQRELTGTRHSFSLHVFDVLFDEMRRCNDMQARIERCYR